MRPARGRQLQAAIEAVEAAGDRDIAKFDQRTKAIDYQDLNPRRLREVAAFFEFDLPAEAGDLSRVLSVYSKDPARKIPFQDDRARKRRLASRAVVAASQKWAMPAYIELERRGAW